MKKRISLLALTLLLILTACNVQGEPINQPAQTKPTAEATVMLDSAEVAEAKIDPALLERMKQSPDYVGFYVYLKEQVDESAFDRFEEWNERREEIVEAQVALLRQTQLEVEPHILRLRKQGQIRYYDILVAVNAVSTVGTAYAVRELAARGDVGRMMYADTGNLVLPTYDLTKTEPTVTPTPPDPTEVPGLVLDSPEVAAAKIEPALAQAMITSPQKLYFLLYFKEQADYSHPTKTSSDERWFEMNALMSEVNMRTQPVIEVQLKRLIEAGLVRRYFSSYVINAITVRGTADAVRQLAARPEIAKVDLLPPDGDTRRYTDHLYEIMNAPSGTPQP